jgi:hypothetical protein
MVTNFVHFGWGVGVAFPLHPAKNLCAATLRTRPILLQPSSLCFHLVRRHCAVHLNVHGEPLEVV